MGSVEENVPESADSNALKSRVVGIYRDILNDDQLEFDSDTSPCQTGANSLQSVLLVSRLEEEFGISMTMQEFYSMGTTHEMIAFIVKNQNT